jgi:hypothetical protein
MKRFVFLMSIVIAALGVGDGFAESRSDCVDEAQEAVCKRDFPGMSLGGAAAGYSEQGGMSGMSGPSVQGVTDQGLMKSGEKVPGDASQLPRIKLDGTEKKPGQAY